MNQKQALIEALEKGGFSPEPDPGRPERVNIYRTPDPDNPARKPYKLGMPFWVELEEPENTSFSSISQGVRLAHDDIGRTLYYLGKAVGCTDAIDFLKSSKHALERALYAAGITTHKPCEDWRYVEL